MNGRRAPYLAEILIRLARDWDKLIKRRNRIEGPSYWRRGATDKKRKRDEHARIAISIAIVRHPFNWLLDRICKEGKFRSDDLRGAALVEFVANARLASKLATFDETGRSVVLFARMRREYPDECKRIFLPSRQKIVPASAVQLRPGHRLGFFDVTGLCDALDVHPRRRAAFIRKVERGRRELGKACIEDVDAPQNRTRFYYSADSAQVRTIAANYTTPTTA